MDGILSEVMVRYPTPDEVSKVLRSGETWKGQERFSKASLVQAVTTGPVQAVAANAGRMAIRFGVSVTNAITNSVAVFQGQDTSSLFANPELTRLANANPFAEFDRERWGDIVAGSFWVAAVGGTLNVFILEGIAKNNPH